MTDCIRLNENTWRIEDGGVRFFLFCGETRAALIDTGMQSPGARALVEGLTPLPLVVVHTHADPDHISGNGAFGEAYMSPAEEENYRAHGGEGSIIPISEGDVIDLGGRALEVIDVPGHTPGSVALLDRKNRVLVSGDSVQSGNIFMFGHRRDIHKYIESMKHLLSFDGAYDEIYPMHGDFPVKPDLIPKLVGAAEAIVSGASEGEKKSVFGKEVFLHKFPFAGFLCDPPAPTLETARLLIGPIEESDKEDYFNNISHDKKVLETFICRYAETLEDFDFSGYVHRDGMFAIRLKDTKKLIGIILYFDEADGACEIGYGIGSGYWNRGYTTEAVARFLEYLMDEKGIHTVYASYFTGNDASRRVMEKCGMTYSRFSEKELTYLGAERDLTYYVIKK